MRWSLNLVALVLLMSVGALLSSCGKKAETPVKTAVRYPVEVAPVTLRPLALDLTATGSVQAFETVRITALVAGSVQKVMLREGATVSVGDIVVEIDPEHYAIAVTTAQAGVARAQAQLDDAKNGMKRREDLAQTEGLIRAEDLDQARTRVQQAVAELAQAQASLAAAQLDLKRAHVAAPLAGVVQSREVDTGAYVQPGQQLATLVRREPLLLRFSVDSEQVGLLRVGAPVRLRVPGQADDFGAAITLVSAVADPATRQVLIMAEITDPKREHIVAGTFATVTIPAAAPHDAIMVPELAVRPSERGFLGFVIVGTGAQAVAHERLLTTGLRARDGSIEIRAGLTVGEQLVVRGAEALRDGVPVDVVTKRAVIDDDEAAAGAAGTVNPAP